MGGVKLIDFNGFPAHLSEEIEAWLSAQNISYGFVYGKAVSYSERNYEQSGRKVKSNDVRIHFWLEFDNPQDAVLFRLTWC
ncbi:hypothetical protein D3C71_1039630 [compost metagenome]